MSIFEENIKGWCERRDCLYNENGRCEMWDEMMMPDDVDDCENFENF